MNGLKSCVASEATARTRSEKHAAALRGPISRVQVQVCGQVQTIAVASAKLAIR